MRERPPRDPRRSRNALLGLVALGLLVGAIAATWFTLKGNFEGGVPVNAVFSAPGVGQQLPTGGDVKIRGVLVGRIAGTHLDGTDRVVVEMQLHSDVEIPADSRATIRSKTLFGQKWVELVPPPGNAGPFLHAGSVIPDDRTREPLELEHSLQLGHELLSAVPNEGLSTVLRNLAEGFTGRAPDARAAIDKGLKALRAVNARRGELDLALRQLRDFSEFLNESDTTVLDFMRSADAANRALVGAAPEFTASLQSVPVFLNDLAGFQVRTEKDLGRLIERGATLAEILEARSDDLTDLVVELEPFTTVWNSGLEQPCKGLFESNLTCWQVYQVPGFESRGLYRKGNDPASDDPGDPLYGRAHRSNGLTQAEVASLLADAAGAPAPASLADVLFAPARAYLDERGPRP